MVATVQPLRKLPRILQKLHQGDDYYDRFASLAATLFGIGGAPHTTCDSLGITSCTRRQGVTTIGVNLAIAAAEASRQDVLLIDANIHHPRLHRLFGVPRGPGFSGAVTGAAALSDCLYETPVPNLTVLPAGHSSSSRDVANPIGHRELLKDAARDFRLVIVDLTPALESGPWYATAGLLDGVLLVVDSRKSQSTLVEQTRRRIAALGANLIGAVLNRHLNTT